MNWKQRYINLMRDSNFHTWHENGHLKGIEDPHTQVVTATMLENQKLYNDVVKNDSVNKPVDLDFAIEVVKRVIPNLLVNKIGSVQPLTSPNGIVLLNKWSYDAWSQSVVKTIKDEDIMALTRPYKTDGLVEDVEQFSERIITDTNKEHVMDIRNNCGTIGKCNIEKLPEMISGMIEKLHRKSLFPVRWALLGQGLFDKGVFDHLPQIKTYVIDIFPPGEIVMGCRGDMFWEGSYIYSPYIMLNKVAPTINPDTFEIKQSYVTRRGKKLTRDGAKWFGKITIE